MPRHQPFDQRVLTLLYLRTLSDPQTSRAPNQDVSPHVNKTVALTAARERLATALTLSPGPPTPAPRSRDGRFNQDGPPGRQGPGSYGSLRKGHPRLPEDWHYLAPDLVPRSFRPPISRPRLENRRPCYGRSLGLRMSRRSRRERRPQALARDDRPLGFQTRSSIMRTGRGPVEMTRVEAGSVGSHTTRTAPNLPAARTLGL